MVQPPHGEKLVSGAFRRGKQRLRRRKKGERVKTKTNQTWTWVQTSKSLQTGQSCKYVSQYNLKQKKIITIKYVLNALKEEEISRDMGIKEGYLGAMMFVTARRTEKDGDGSKGIPSKGRIVRKAAEMQT